jgi:hypothetical protein
VQAFICVFGGKGLSLRRRSARVTAVDTGRASCSYLMVLIVLLLVAQSRLRRGSQELDPKWKGVLSSRKSSNLDDLSEHGHFVVRRRTVA